jgi:hypothetical protein
LKKKLPLFLRIIRVILKKNLFKKIELALLKYKRDKYELPTFKIFKRKTSLNQQVS